MPPAHTTVSLHHCVLHTRTNYMQYVMQRLQYIERNEAACVIQATVRMLQAITLRQLLHRQRQTRTRLSNWKRVAIAARVRFTKLHAEVGGRACRCATHTTEHVYSYVLSLDPQRVALEHRAQLRARHQMAALRLQAALRVRRWHKLVWRIARIGRLRRSWAATEMQRRIRGKLGRRYSRAPPRTQVQSSCAVTRCVLMLLHPPPPDVQQSFVPLLCTRGMQLRLAKHAASLAIA